MRIGTIAALVLGLTISVGITARAADYGPKRDIAAIRSEVPVLLARGLSGGGYPNGPTVVDHIVIVDTQAAATWHRGTSKGLVLLSHARSTHGWWLVAETTFNPNERWWQQGPLDQLGCGRARSALDSDELSDLGFSAALIAAAHAHLPLLVRPWPRTVGVSYLDCMMTPKPASALQTFWDDTDEFEGLLTANVTSDVLFDQRGSTDDELAWRHGTSTIYYFQLTARSSPAASLTNATLSVWFPFVLDTNATYDLSLSLSDPELPAIPGTLRDNVLTFELPPFTLPVGKAALGEITARK